MKPGFFQVEDEGFINFGFSIASERGFASGVMATGNDVTMNSHLTMVALRSGLLVTEEIVAAEHRQ